ncbi:MAG: PspC domain-containing protein [Acidimicrobiales bacterium]|jgi:phage shock protein PspC (stress-responsive transcriptional regulator)
MTSDTTTSPVLRRPADGRMLAGVAEGLAHHFTLDVTVIRIALVLAALVGPGVPLYVAAWLLIPEEGAEQSVLSELIDSARPA